MMEWHIVENWPVYLAVLFFLYWLSVLAVLINDLRDPTRTLAWLTVLTFLPLLGLILYFFLGRNWKKTSRDHNLSRLNLLEQPVLDRIRKKYAPKAGQAIKQPLADRWECLVRLVLKSGGSPPLPAYDIQMFTNGKDKFDHLKKDIAKARRSINIQYFIWEHDQLTAQLCSLLKQSLSRGVQVRILNDFIGCMPYSKKELRELSRAGARVHFDVRQIGQANYRNHRKIAVIDEILGYTGGINVGQEYIDGGSRYPAWRDTHLRFLGPAVAELQRLFCRRWYRATGENLFGEQFFPQNYPSAGTMFPVQVAATSVEDKWETAHRAHCAAISRARKCVWIQSPYFVPDDQIYEGLINAALSDLDVRLMITGWPDKKTAWYAAHSYFEALLEAGARVFLYNKGFMHAKTMSVDSAVLAAGTMNMDIRSLQLHKELMVWILDASKAAEHEKIFMDDLLHCREISLEDLASLSRLEKFRNASFRLASNLL
ncbi:MAG: cardiolipin synthase [Desulfonatronovibrionaceae bacterium]